MQICGRAGRGHGKTAPGTEKKVACLKVPMEELPGKNSQQVYQQQNRVWQELVFVLLHPTATGCMQRLKQENMGAFTGVMMQAKPGQ